MDMISNKTMTKTMESKHEKKKQNIERKENVDVDVRISINQNSLIAREEGMNASDIVFAAFLFLSALVWFIGCIVNFFVSSL